MRTVLVERLVTGDRLGRDVFTGVDGLPLLRAGVRVSDGYRRSLLRAGISSVWVDDGISEGIEPLDVLQDTTKRQATAAIHEALREIARTLPQQGTISSDTVHEMTTVAELIVSDVASNVHSALALNDLANADGYTLKHSLAVTTLGLSLGARVMRKYGWIDLHGRRRLDRVGERLALLGVGLLLHDIGKLAVPSEILRKPGPLDDAEWQAMRAHPLMGVEILKKAHGISPLARVVVRSHHERWNGSGYPDGQVGQQIHQFARIAAAADVFDALTSDRSYRRALPVHEAYDTVVSGADHDFDPEVIDIFRTFVAPYPTGTGVVLSDGYHALVHTVRPDAVATPIVRVIADQAGAPVTPHEIDLSRTPGLSILGTLDALAISV